jgi:pimeloyl-ACP methyl ester carboxylesterase
MQRRDTERSGEWEQSVRIPSGAAVLNGELMIPRGAGGVVLFAHGSGSSRHSPRNQYVARVIRVAGIGTLLFDLLTSEEEAVDMYTRRLRFDIDLLADRLVDATKWIDEERRQLKYQTGAQHLRVGYFGASTGAAAALVAAARLGESIGAVVSRGGRPDLAGDALPLVVSPTLLIVGGADGLVIELNKEAFASLRCKKEMKIVPGATHLFEEPDALEQVARLAAEWFKEHLQAQPRTSAASG